MSAADLFATPVLLAGQALDVRCGQSSRFIEVEVDAVPIVEGFSMAVEVFSHGPTIEAGRGGNLDFGVKPRSGENKPEKRRNLFLKQLLNAPTRN